MQTKPPIVASEAPGVPCVMRRAFLQWLGALSAAASLPLAGCAANIEDNTGTSEGAIFEAQRARTMNALFDVLIPANGPNSPGAVEVRTLEFMRNDDLLRTAISLGYVTDISKTPLGNAVGRAAATALEIAITTSLDLAAKGTNLLKGFAELPRLAQEKIVKDAFANPVQRPLFELARVAAMFSYVGAVYTDAGLVAMGVPAYENFAARRHNNGFPNFCPNLVPTANGVAAWAIDLT